MMKGYWNKPTLTQKSFYIETPMAGVDKIYYRTGDQVLQDEEGKLLFFGRKDHQVKLRGYRIELGEIENTLASHLLVKEAVAMVIYNPTTEEKELVTAVLLLSLIHI